MGVEDYSKAQKSGQKSYQKNLMEGKYPYLQVLEEILSHTDAVSEQKLGLVQIPAELIVGTYTAGRRTAFAPNFMPLLEDGTEFAGKWSRLCDAHMKEGIREPIIAYEFMNRYYVVEGNKRVSVLKYFNAVTVPGYVTRMIPKRTDEPANRLYFEYLDFNRKTGVNYLVFSQPGSYKRLLEAMNKEKAEDITEKELEELRSSYARFSSAFRDKGGDKLDVSASDAMLTYIEMYSYVELSSKMPAQLKEDIGKIWDDVLLLTRDQTTEIVMEPSEAPKMNFFERLLLTSANKKLKIAFIHDKNKEDSAWTYGHELGRMYLQDEFSKHVETMCLDNVTPGESLDRAFDAALRQKCDIIFTTTPQFLETSLKMAVKYPNVKILNCSVNPSHRYVRTYYARLYEAKFLAGIIAGSMSASGKIGYMADYPINGMIANINAFAFGARMVNPRAKVYLEWSSVRSKKEILDDYRAKGVTMVSCQEMITPSSASREFGLISLENEEPENIALAIWNWGALYKRLIQSIQDGSWKTEDDGLAMSYWWGMSADVIDIICSKKVPEATMRLVQLMKREICSGSFHPFSGTLYTQDGPIPGEENKHLDPEEIIGMNWLAENVIGSFPQWENLSGDAKAIVRLQGVETKDEKENMV
ncbi:MAG: BMP family ABC transporter substrate-binding protein [Lachnospiraceae bacterium]|nr:BMP family ABC transporter substrate-binding protein [Lachnospiraceae bacterium]